MAIGGSKRPASIHLVHANSTEQKHADLAVCVLGHLQFLTPAFVLLLLLQEYRMR
jgi:hypothetical protein